MEIPRRFGNYRYSSLCSGITFHSIDVVLRFSSMGMALQLGGAIDEETCLIRCVAG